MANSLTKPIVRDLFFSHAKSIGLGDMIYLDTLFFINIIIIVL